MADYLPVLSSVGRERALCPVRRRYPEHSLLSAARQALWEPRRGLPAIEADTRSRPLRLHGFMKVMVRSYVENAPGRMGLELPSLISLLA